MAIIDLDPKNKHAVLTWRERNYEGASLVTKRLFEFWRCQREAIEALIYIHEVCKYHSLYDLARGFGVSIQVDPTKDLFG